MTDQVAILADIRPGKRAELERVLAQGPPFDLTKEGFEHHEVFLGDNEVVFVFTGPGAARELQRLAAGSELAHRDDDAERDSGRASPAAADLQLGAAALRNRCEFTTG